MKFRDAMKSSETSRVFVRRERICVYKHTVVSRGTVMPL